MGRGRSPESLRLVELAAEILAEIQPASVRAVAYQLFIRGAIRGMDKGSTNKVSAQLTRAREEGEIPWEWIVQEGREIEGLATWEDPRTSRATSKACTAGISGAPSRST
jgi:hypothetical protein